MGTLTRKQREIQQRERMLMDVARRLLLEQGFAGFAMDRLCELTEYSKGVIYQHFSSKEDLVAALAIQSLEERMALFERAAHFDGRPRERMMAIGVAEELFVRLHPHHFHSEQIIKLADLSERVSEARQLALQTIQNQCFAGTQAIVEDGIAAGDLALPGATTSADIVVGLWALTFGFYTLLHTHRELLIAHGVTSPFRAVRQHCHTLLDGYGWQPLTPQWDYELSFRRVQQEVFPEECLQAGLE